MRSLTGQKMPTFDFRSPSKSAPRSCTHVYCIFRCKYNAVAQQITSNVAQLSTVPDGFPINFFFFLSFEQLQKLVIVKHFRDNFRIRYLSTLVARWFSYFVIGCYDKKRERAGLISVIKINCIEIYSVAII